MGCGCGGGGAQKTKLKSKSMKSQDKPKVVVRNRIKAKTVVKPTPTPIKKKAVTKYPKENVQHIELLSTCPRCRTKMRTVKKLGTGTFIECSNPACKFSRKTG